jgi:1,4-alpha-glucan branching enzyme
VLVIYTENHDEVGHPPRQRRIPVRIDEKNPGSLSARRRSLLGAALLMTAPGVPMLFQGQEFLEDRDFVFPTGAPLDWNKTTRFGGILLAYRDLIALRRNIAGVTAALQGPLLQVFHQDEASQVLAFRRWDPKSAHQVAVVANFGPQYFASYPVGLPTSGIWSVLFTSDDARYSGDFGGTPHARSFNAILNGRDGMPYSVSVEIAPFSAVVLGN